MIRRRDRLAADLANMDKRVRLAIVEYSREQGFLVPLRIEKVRPMLGLDSHGAHHGSVH